MKTMKFFEYLNSDDIDMKKYKAHALSNVIKHKILQLGFNVKEENKETDELKTFLYNGVGTTIAIIIYYNNAYSKSEDGIEIMIEIKSTANNTEGDILRQKYEYKQIFNDIIKDIIKDFTDVSFHIDYFGKEIQNF